MLTRPEISPYQYMNKTVQSTMEMNGSCLPWLATTFNCLTFRTAESRSILQIGFME